MYTLNSLQRQREEVLFHFKNANYFYVVISVFLSMLSHMVRAYRWNFMLQPLGYRPKIAQQLYGGMCGLFNEYFYSQKR